MAYVIRKLEPCYPNGGWNQEMPPDASPELLEEAHIFSRLKVGYRGDLKFREHPDVIEVAPLFTEQTLLQGMKMEQ